MTSRDIMATHLKAYPDCTEKTCPHVKGFIGMVTFKEPDKGFIATIEAFDVESAEVVFREGIARDYPDLHIKKMEVDKI